MKVNRLFSAILSAALLIGLCACGPGDPAGDGPSAGVSAPALLSPTWEVPKASEAQPEASAAPEPTPSSFAQYDKTHRLDVSIPALIDGLEMPVVGATGYTSVALPLWRSIPYRPGPGVTPEPGPDTTPEPDPDTTPEPGPEVTPEPGPDTTPEPGPEVTPEPSPDTTPEPGPEVTPEPGPDTTPEPGPNESPEVNPGAPPEINPGEPPEINPGEPPEPDLEEARNPMAVRTYTAGSAPKSIGISGFQEEAVAVWEPGVAFLILEESGGWWRVSRGNETGWIEHRYCMINLPDVIPSIIYDDTNAYSSRFVSCGKTIPGVTGEVFYHSLVYNVRLDRQEFVMPILYSAARKICAVQHRALEEGNCLRVYQAFRPYETQMKVANALAQLANVDPEVKAGVSASPWSMDWFIDAGVSSHQRGYALDASMVKVYKAETKYAGSCSYLNITNYEEYQMPTAVYELSVAAISAPSPGSSQFSRTMTEPAIALRDYFISAGLNPLASEWWHFNDLEAMEAASANPSDGRYYITECLSHVPERTSRAWF